MKLLGKVLKALLLLATGVAAGYALNNHIKNKVMDKETQRVNKFKGYYTILNQWITLKQRGKDLSGYFLEKGYREIAIYGMGELGLRLYDELRDTEVHVKYAIDKNAGSSSADLEVYELQAGLPAVDAVIVTATFAFDEIEEELCSVIGDIPIISFEDVVFEA